MLFGHRMLGRYYNTYDRYLEETRAMIIDQRIILIEGTKVYLLNFNDHDVLLLTTFKNSARET